MRICLRCWRFAWARLLWASSTARWTRPIARRDEGPVLQPSGLYSDEQLKEGIPDDVIRQDMKRLSTLTTRVRTYNRQQSRSHPLHRQGLWLEGFAGIWLKR